MAALRTSWRGADDPSRTTGVVKSVLDGGKSGFIRFEDGSDDIFFSLPRNSTKDAPAPGTHVSFRVVDGFDKKKNRPSKRAVDVRIE